MRCAVAERELGARWSRASALISGSELAHAYDVSLGWAGDEQDGQAVLETALDGLELRCR